MDRLGRSLPLWAGAGLLTLVSSAFGGAPENLSILDPVSPAAAPIRSLFHLVLVVTLVILVLVEFILIYSVIRFRRRPNTNQNEPPQVYGSTPIEIAWTVAPTLIVFLLVLVVIRTEYEVRVDPDQPPDGAEPLRVTVIGHQWWWEYVYEEYDGRKLSEAGSTSPVPGIVVANELHVPASEAGIPRPVYLTLRSADVCHSYWVPRLAGKTDLIPGRVNQMWFQTERPGLYLGQCAEYCGTQHANMLLRVYVDSPERFTAWLDQQAQPASDPPMDNPRAVEGKHVFLSESCINCHAVRGTLAKGTYAPDLTHLMSRETLASGMIPNTPENLRKWVADPQQIKRGCLMPAFGLSEENLDLVVAYLLTLK